MTFTLTLVVRITNVAITIGVINEATFVTVSFAFVFHSKRTSMDGLATIITFISGIFYGTLT
tara:strand:+ start:56 stop:241 length:186 start_codon:yes stop_codon:yes gene_type:complete